MTTPFVPVDLDKLLDEFEETEEVPRTSQGNSCSEENGIVVDASSSNGHSSLKGAKQIYHPAFPCIQEEGCSDQGSDGQSDDNDDYGSDCSSVGRIILAAEAITSSNHNHDLIPELREQVGCNDPKGSLSNCDNCSSNHSEISSTQKDADNSRSGDSGIDKEDGHSYFQCEQIVVNTSESQNAVAVSPEIISHCVTPEERVYKTDGNGLCDDISSEQSSEMLHPQNTCDEKEQTSKREEDWSIGGGNSEPSEVDKNSRDIECVGNLVYPSVVADSIGAPTEQQTGDTYTRNNSLSLNSSGSQSVRSDGNISDLNVSQASDEQLTDLVNNASLAELQHLSSITVSQDESETRHAVSQPNLRSDLAEGSQTNVDNDSSSPHVSFVETSGITGASDQTSFEPINQDVHVSDQGVNEPWENSVLGARMSGSCMGMTPQGSTGARRISSGESCLGSVPPIWVPDSVATHCMNCGLKFSVIKRRHHCRACGKALCSSCCNMKFMLPYMDNREGRVCQICCSALLRAGAERPLLHQGRSNCDSHKSMHNSAEDEAVEELTASLDSELERVHDAEHSLQGTEGTEENVADSSEVNVTRHGILPAVSPLQLPETSAISQLSTDVGTPLATPSSPALSDDSDCLFRLDIDNVRSMLPEDITALPPVVSVVSEEITIQERPDPAEIMYQLKGCHATVVFMLNKNLVVKVKIVKLKCCVKRKCWCFITEGMGAANQEEMVVLLECLDKETLVPKDVLSHFNTAFAYAKQGHTVSELGYTIFGQPFLGSSDNAGFLYVKPTFQCLKNVPLPSTPYVVGVLIKRMETPWAQLFPLRLQLRLGAEYRYYPCPLFSTRNRPAVYQEIGHTIMNLLADFKNFQYTLARVTGLVIHMEENRTLVRLPQDRYDEVIKILNATDEHVMALGANFSHQADSHLVCIQNEQGYKTQAINIQNQARKVTGASFIVFSGALKASSPFSAKVNIVEDGIMVQMIPQLIGGLRHSLKEMQDYTITTGERGDELVVVEWVSRQDALQHSSLCSPIDGLRLDSFPCVKVHSGCDFTRKSIYRIQWTEVYFLGDRHNSSVAWQQCASRDLNQLTTELAKAFCLTLRPHLRKLTHDNFTLIGLRVNLDSDDVGYSTGSNRQSLATDILSELDTVLVPVIHSAVSRHRGPPLNVELFFKILRLL